MTNSSVAVSIGRTIRVEIRDPLDPIDWNGTATFSRGS
jgi:hypothetical protein